MGWAECPAVAPRSPESKRTHQASTADWPADARNPGRATYALQPEPASLVRSRGKVDQLLATESNHALEAIQESPAYIVWTCVGISFVDGALAAVVCWQGGSSKEGFFCSFFFEPGPVESRFFWWSRCDPSDTFILDEGFASCGPKQVPLTVVLVMRGRSQEAGRNGVWVGRSQYRRKGIAGQRAFGRAW